MSFKRKIEVSVCVSIFISIILSIFSFAETSDRVRQDVLRLHVLANSDSISDQQLKLKVRDAVLAGSPMIFDGSVDIENAVEKIKPRLDSIKSTAERIIRENGRNYSVKVTLSRDFFTTRTYENVTLPAGKYLALRIVIGEGRGHNWWCVMFPPMCLPAAEKKTEIENVLDKRETSLVEKNPKYEVRFKLVEIYEEIKMKIDEKKNKD